MLQTLRIRNLALVAELTVHFEPGLGVLTGETGAGKSVILGALNLVLGQRADRSAIRSGADQCTVEAVFDVGRLPGVLAAFLEENGIEACVDHQLILKRSFSSSGANRQFVNGSPTTLVALATLGNWLVDLHGPHEHQSLLNSAQQLAILDAFGNLAAQRKSMGELIRQRAGVEAEMASLIVDERTYAQQIDLLRHQAREIADARLQTGEDEAVEVEHRRVQNAARLLDLCQSALDALADGEESATSRLAIVGRSLHELAKLDPTQHELTETHAQALELHREVQHRLSLYSERVDADPARLAQLEQRLDLLQSLKRKYGPRLEDVRSFGVQAQEKLNSLESRESELARLRAQKDQFNGKILEHARSLSRARASLIPRLVRAVKSELAGLGFRQPEFSISHGFNTDAIGTTGGDQIEFQFAPNPGEPARPLKSIASSGELARVMLALKTVLAVQDEVPVLVFDEVDANIGGETGHVVGQKLSQIAQHHQVLCITHLAPVAVHGSSHYVVTKDVINGRTESQVTRLTPAKRIEELARMLGGGAAAQRHAEALLESVQGKKRNAPTPAPRPAGTGSKPA